MMDSGPGVSRVYSYDCCIGDCLKLVRTGGTYEYLGGRNQARKVHEVAEREDLGNCLDGALSEDSEKTFVEEDQKRLVLLLKRY